MQDKLSTSGIQSIRKELFVANQCGFLRWNRIITGRLLLTHDKIGRSDFCLQGNKTLGRSRFNSHLQIYFLPDQFISEQV